MPILDFNDPNPAFGGGGGSLVEFADVDELVATHQATPLVDGSFWHTPNPEMTGTVIGGELSPNPVTFSNALTRSTNQTRVVIRGITPSATSRINPHTIEVV